MHNQSVTILDVRVDVVTQHEVIDHIRGLLSAPEKRLQQLVTTNPEFIIEAQKNQDFKRVINSAWLSVADGYGIQLAAQYNELAANHDSAAARFFDGMKIAWWGMTRNQQRLNKIPEIITGVSLIDDIARVAEQLNKKLFLLGGFGDTPQKVAAYLRDHFPSLEVESAIFESDKVIERINACGAHVLFVAINHPRAQLWIDGHAGDLPSVQLAIGVGGAFDYLAHAVGRAPRSWQHSYEWLYRLIRQPRRFKRIWNAFPRFAWKVYRNKMN